MPLPLPFFLELAGLPASLILPPGCSNFVRLHPQLFQAKLHHRRTQLCSKAGSNQGCEKFNEKKQGAGECREGKGRKYFSSRASQLRFPLGSTSFYSEEVGKSNFVCLFPPLQKSIQPSGRLSCRWLAGGSLDHKLCACTSSRPSQGKTRGGVTGLSGKNNAAFIYKCSLTAGTRKRPPRAKPGASGHVSKSPVPPCDP